MQIDFYVDVIDNFWDMGFAYHIAQRLVERKPEVKIRFFSHDKNLFDQISQNDVSTNITYFDESEKYSLASSRIIYNFFDKKLDEKYLKSFDFEIQIYNFTYFMMHKWCQNLHNTSYTTHNLTIRHLVPSLLFDTFWVVIPEQKNIFSRDEIANKYNISQENISKKWVGVFCYGETFSKIEKEFETFDDTLFFIFDERNRSHAKNALNMPFLPMQEYYDLMQSFDANIVRGENTLVAGVMTQKPFLWDIYKENNGQHSYKIDEFGAFLRKEFSLSGEYSEMFKEFNLWDTSKSFASFLRWDFWGIFSQVSEYVQENCDLLEKLEKEIFEK